MFLGRSKFCEQFLKRVTQGTFLWYYFKIGPAVSEKKIFKELLKNSIAWQPEFLMESNSVNKFWRGPPKEHSCQVGSKLAQQFGRRRCLKKLLTTHEGHITTLKAPLEHVVLRWAKKVAPLIWLGWAIGPIRYKAWQNSASSFKPCNDSTRILAQIKLFTKQKNS